jgi:hypothetical protein
MVSQSFGWARLRVKYSFSRQHLAAARLYADLAAKLEDELKSPAAPDPGKAAHRAHVTSAVVFSVGFLESSINEFYLEASDKNTTALAGMAEPQIEAVAALWPETEQRFVITKYNKALLACGKRQLDEESNLVQAVESAVVMRNAIVHYRPEWDDTRVIHADLQQRMKGRFKENALAEQNSLWFPHLCLGRGCAEWCVENAIAFMTEFCSRLGIPSRC